MLCMLLGIDANLQRPLAAVRGTSVDNDKTPTADELVPFAKDVDDYPFIRILHRLFPHRRTYIGPSPRLDIPQSLPKMSEDAKSHLTFRPPSSSSAQTTQAFVPPNPDFLKGSWHVTHSTLPMWKSNRNVVITYTPLDSPPGSIDDLVEYKPLDSDKLKTVRGVDTPHPTNPAAYNWRGKGWLMIASSHWEVLGYGEEEGGWVATFFQKTLFTPPGIDVYARVKGGLSTNLVARILEDMKKIEDTSFQKLADTMFEIKHEWHG